MGAGASVKKCDTPTAVTAVTGAVDLEARSMPDPALRNVLRNLQLSPDVIEESTAAIYAHVRDPIGHPVDKSLARLCASEYTRGALHALSWYLIVASENRSGTPSVVKIGEGTAAVAPQTALAAEAEGDGDRLAGLDRDTRPSPSSTPIGEESVMTESMTGRLATFLSRLKRTRSMPSREHGLVIPGDDEQSTTSFHPTGGSTMSTRGRRAGSNSKCDTPPKLNIRVNTPRSPRRPNLLAGLGLSSPSARSPGGTPPRRAPVRTGHWKLGHEIGKGSFGTVHIGLNEDSGDLIAVKVLSLRSADAAEPLYAEIELMRQLTHPNIVSYLGAEANDAEKTISIFQEWVPGSVTTLLVNFGSFSDRRIAGYTKQILQGLLYLHNERVIHRDIKGGNILIDDRGVVKLCDFGASKMLDSDSFAGLDDHTRVGSPLFMAPEILLREDYGPQVDIWSLGGAVLEMATGHPPWHTLNLRTPVALINWVKRTEGPPPLPEALSQPLKAFLLRCFERNPNKRATAKELLSDPFVAKRHGEVVQASASDADSVSDIDNLSRTAAIARIRRASVSDCSRPNSSGSYASDALTPRSPRAEQPSGGNGAGGGSAGHEQARHRSPTASGSASHHTFGGLAHQPGETLDTLPAQARGSSPHRPLSFQAARTPPLHVITSGLEASPGSRVVTPPGRRLSTGRGSSVSPNPFGGRRRSLESSPDGSRSPRGSVPVALPAVRHAGDGARDGVVSKACNGVDEGARGVDATRTEKVDTVGVTTAAAAAEGGADDGSSTKRGSIAPSPPKTQRRDPGNSGVSTRSSGSQLGGQEGGGPVPTSETAPRRTLAEARPNDLELTPSKPTRSGRGGRPSNRGSDMIAGGEATACR